MLAVARAPVPVVVYQHLEDAASLRQTRSVLVRAPHVRLHLLRRLDDRIAASLDGLAVAGDLGQRLCVAALEAPSRGAVFAATVSAIEGRNPPLLEQLLALAEAELEARIGLVSAFGWVPAASLRGIIKALLGSPHPFHRDIGLAACGMHHADPGAVLDDAIGRPDGRMRAVSVAGHLGRLDLLPACLAGLAHEDPHQQFSSAQSSVLLGDRWAAVEKLSNLALECGPCQMAASLLVFKLLPAEQVRGLLQSMAQDPSWIRTLIRAIGAAGDPHYVPWLIAQMNDLALARLAGESFCMITGADLTRLDLERAPPDDLESGPSDNPDDESVAMDEDDSLPWPEPDRIAAWWREEGGRFLPGTRYFVGEVPSPAHCLSVLRTAPQRQRVAAAEYLCLLQPGIRLFPTRAPAWRQRRWLDAMNA